MDQRAVKLQLAYIWGRRMQRTLAMDRRGTVFFFYEIIIAWLSLILGVFVCGSLFLIKIQNAVQKNHNLLKQPRCRVSNDGAVRDSAVKV